MPMICCVGSKTLMPACRSEKPRETRWPVLPFTSFKAALSSKTMSVFVPRFRPSLAPVNDKRFANRYPQTRRWFCCGERLGILKLCSQTYLENVLAAGPRGIDLSFAGVCRAPDKGVKRNVYWVHLYFNVAYFWAVGQLCLSEHHWLWKRGNSNFPSQREFRAFSASIPVVPLLQELERILQGFLPWIPSSSILLRTISGSKRSSKILLMP